MTWQEERVSWRFRHLSVFRWWFWRIDCLSEGASHAPSMIYSCILVTFRVCQSQPPHKAYPLVAPGKDEKVKPEVYEEVGEFGFGAAVLVQLLGTLTNGSPGNSPNELQSEAHILDRWVTPKWWIRCIHCVTMWSFQGFPMKTGLWMPIDRRPALNLLCWQGPSCSCSQNKFIVCLLLSPCQAFFFGIMSMFEGRTNKEICEI